MNTKSPYDLPRLGRTEDDFVCKFCDFHAACWHGVIPDPIAPSGGFNPNNRDEVPF